MSTITTELEVDVPVGVAYNQWTQFEKFPTFMEGVKEVRQLDDTTLEWCIEIAGVERDFVADILVQEPDQCIAWASRDGRDHAGSVSFESIDVDRTRIALRMEYEPGNWTEKVADALQLIDLRTRRDLRNFKEMIEDRNGPTGGWRGSVNGGRVERATPTSGTETTMPPVDAERGSIDPPVHDPAVASRDRAGGSRSDRGGPGLAPTAQ